MTEEVDNRCDLCKYGYDDELWKSYGCPQGGCACALLVRVPPLKCPQCKSTSATKKGGTIYCSECGVKTHSSGKTEKIKKYASGKGRDPRYETGDYLDYGNRD